MAIEPWPDEVFIRAIFDLDDDQGDDDEPADPQPVKPKTSENLAEVWGLTDGESDP